MKNSLLLSGIYFSYMFLSRIDFLIAQEANVLYENPMGQERVETIRAYQQRVEVDFFVLKNLPPLRDLQDIQHRPESQSALADLNVQPVSNSSPAPSVSFQGLLDSMRFIPPDTNGSVGLNHVMTMLNDRVQIQTKTGTVISTVWLEDFWNDTTTFDPQLLYDPYNNRWIAAVAINGDQPSSGFLVAVSQTSDPTGGWYRFSVKGDPNSLLTVDFPRLGFNGKWVVIQANMFSISGGGFDSSKVFVLDKSQLYAGALGSVTVFDLTGVGGTQTPAITYDADLPTLYLLQNWTGNSNGQGVLRLYAIEGSVGSETIRTVGFPSVSRTWSSNGPFMNGGFAPQLNSTARIDVGSAGMTSVVYRNGSVWGAHMVYLPQGAPVRIGVQWWQIDPTTLTVQQFGRIEDKTANLNAGKHLAYPSIGVNSCNDVLIGYSLFRATAYPSAAYSFRFSTDPVNTTQKVAILKSGLAVYNKDYGSGRNRWGDYSSTPVDPNGFDIWTLQEYAESMVNGESRWGTWWGKIALSNNPC